jgi:hypothetical protein
MNIEDGDFRIAYSEISGTTHFGRWTYANGDTVVQSGSLTVTISPAAAVSAGAGWSLDGGSWNTGGTTVSDIPVGKYTITCRSLSGWITPERTFVTISNDETASVTRTYKKRNFRLKASAPVEASETGMD